MIYDLGGGTFDVSIIEIGDGVIEVLATNGDNHLGGDDFDERITEYLISEIQRQYHADVKKDYAALQRVREAAEQAKKELSDAEIEQAIRDAEQYAAQDGVRRNSLEVVNRARRVLSEAEQALHKVGKQLAKEEKKQIKEDCSALRKLLGRYNPETVTESDMAAIKAASDRLEQSSANARRLAG